MRVLQPGLVIEKLRHPMVQRQFVQRLQIVSGRTGFGTCGHPDYSCISLK
ncbi:Uncharacterised protein [Bordetella pertussis]|nr:Uncharacterised protein [Bordetella pertussis]CFU85950.1 Uncharacterised protein [Bordetella pertussis]CPI24869.1 Uncharacterised protein [Bordetella pertussis]CPL54364.1 Uncharacterised protein [Bordetella pertussis]CPM16148.1 Uncharacterised protein [Bordetella pertussis]